ncbi:hypothetical protein [Tahibacter amnicola]|uniref:VWFD domain-containing protein n=1 Tax=Tahibacter amnicola TaxID=2976241 RepID=A0ABY6B7I3_9GAMM|nr:hypothetical protein [Tahibacter amnicola]UXI65849.1 hypothetical protein N4264_13880 [Tahibacter amnicola]
MRLRLRCALHRVREAIAATCLAAWTLVGLAQTGEPIATIGHGGFFDAQGKQIRVTQAFVEQAQSWYRTDLLTSIDDDGRRAFAEFERNLLRVGTVKGQTRLVARQYGLEWLFAHSARHRDDDRLLGKLRALEIALRTKLPEKANDRLPRREPFVLTPLQASRWTALRVKPKAGMGLLSPTVNSGQLYINECMDARVPIPPPIGQMDPNGTAGWKSQGFIPETIQFIVGTPAELRSYKSTSPAGMCYALPRYVDDTLDSVQFDGVICLSEETSKVCFWDNQMSGVGFTFDAGDQIPIGVPNLAIDPEGRYQAGGYELLGGTGGVCTDCHAGENPYITHPDADLGDGVLWSSLSGPPENLPTFAPNRYEPIVPAEWPQNDLSQAGPTVPVECGGCHVKGVAGRFPHLSNELPGYCTLVLSPALLTTMPPPSPGSAQAAAETFRDAYCGFPPDAASADAGDPHITTTNGVHYDFQAAGEFVVLKNSATGFELQSRQSPVQTTFTPPPNAYTGLSSCVSLNTAVAIRAGKHRITYQPRKAAQPDGDMVLRLNGREITATETRLDLGQGSWIAAAESGDGFDIKTGDGTRLTVTPRFWSSQGYWYLDVNVHKTPAREGIAGHVIGTDWLPRAPDGSSFGPRPAALGDRHDVLNRTFANAWRVTRISSLFDYDPGMSTQDFTDKSWPAAPDSGLACKTTLPSNSPLTRMHPELAEVACRRVQDKALRDNCLFDVAVMGDSRFADGYLNPPKGHDWDTLPCPGKKGRDNE